MQISYNRILAYGASVTKQHNGYVDALANLLPAHMSVDRLGYGSMHLKDAGICFMYEVLNQRPDICLLDWFSTAKTDYGDSIYKYLDAIVYQLLNNNIKPILILLPISVMIKDRLDMYDKIIKYCQNYNLHYINIYEQSVVDNISPTVLIKDYVHTNEYGAAYYAQCIYRFLNDNIFSLPDEPIHSHYNTIYPIKNKYVNINSYEPSQTIFAHKYLTLKISDEIVGILQTIGPYSGLVKIFDNQHKNLIKTESIWDSWCYYERENIKISINGPGVYTLSVSNDVINKLSAKTQLNWQEYSNILKIHKIFFTGDIEIIDYE